uniref:Radical SAM core domain-containing protein n=1 Tax=Chromera velia CCMP2878 TaxID=1169474 RepID=A0A0G4FEV4_9ALVE|eukprot:Cvel_16652.t1-p1 / transcript=Cvel_16652.t1 / gene=Cvel_16652 / organism=Chromera_velia_CCMP2878 / gene_product=Dual-specificity RNA methyltransferase RlmN 1, putative / transcript_product=Dual-specificity RNA methyltransferase RlmN 1, putative / location=Cvel_scaffold1291:33989-36096(+) / protein_length=427 / sequence_SO=supercontig / SO=protein_coding / is_pseudo=false
MRGDNKRESKGTSGKGSTERLAAKRNREERETGRDPKSKKWGGQNIFALTSEQLEQMVKDMGLPAYRARQIYSNLYERGALSYEEMTDLPKSLRQRLETETVFGSLSVADEQVSRDGTIKRAYALRDGQLIETVLMPYSDSNRRTVCISSQAGCAQGCKFCATGQMGFARQLRPEEIFEQAARASAWLRKRGERLSNVVFMGMGEPLANYDNVMAAVDRLQADLGIGARHITISTVGLLDRIRKLSLENRQVTLAVSLHSVRDRERSAMIPANQKASVRELLVTCGTYASMTGRRITFEWALIRGKNDTPAEAELLAKLLRAHLPRHMCHVNVIPLNPTPGFAERETGTEGVRKFLDVLERQGISATCRVRRGLDISAGCGQLATELERLKNKGVPVGVGDMYEDYDLGKIPSREIFQEDISDLSFS